MEPSEESEACLVSIQNKLSQLSTGQPPQPCIYKVPKHLRDVNEKAYEPEIIAIGPYHHGKDNFKMMEEYKVRYLRSLLKRIPGDIEEGEKVRTYIRAVANEEHAARDCYAEPISLTKAEFIEMLVLDGCFIIELLQQYGNRESSSNSDPLFQTGWIINSLQRDLMLFENQIPFFVLCRLFKHLTEASNNPETSENLSLKSRERPINLSTDSQERSINLSLNNQQRLADFILPFFKDLYPGAGYEETMNRSSNEVQHLLDLIHYNWLPSSANAAVPQSTEAVPVDMDAQPIRPPSAMKIRRADPREMELRSIHSATENEEAVHRERGLRSIHSATELTNANVTFQKKECDTLFGVEFRDGIMLLPPLTIGDRTECFLRNLIAYEQYSPNNPRTFIIDYVRLMDCLIDSSRDVEILSECGIIDNWLGDNEVVADIFNQLTESVTCPANHFTYAETFRLVNTHYEKRWNRAWAVLKRDYFNSPWAYISFFGALLLLLLTSAQTVFSALQGI